MAIVIPDAGEVKLLDATIAGDEANLTLFLFTNTITPGEAHITSDFTEAAGGGYAAKALAKATWNAASTTSGTTSKTYPEQTFTFTGALTGNATIKGYGVKGASDGVIRWVELITDFQPAANGDTLKITPRLEAA
jgi:hypothetical protein